MNKMSKMSLFAGLLTIFTIAATFLGFSQTVNDSNTPLHLLQPDYEVPYGKPGVEEITAVLDRVYGYLDKTTPMKLVNRVTGNEVVDYSKVDGETQFLKGDFRLISYEWGVTYAGMSLATIATGDAKYAAYTNDRIQFIADILPHFKKLNEEHPEIRTPIYSVLHPHALDDAGAMCAAIIKAQQAGSNFDFNPIIDNYIDYISTKEFRLTDGTLARNRPQPNTIWLDDLFMSVPALAQMGAYSGEQKYFDDAAKQVLQFSDRMFNEQNGLFMHGWVQEMDEHPQFHWARANGWAVMTLVELLEVLPEEHAGRAEVLAILKKHIMGLTNYQSGNGFWHQLIDRNDTYLETSATAIYTYAIARAINRGYVDAKVYGPMVCLAWNAVSTKVNSIGQVEGTCVGTGMGFDPAFYYYRPINVFAAHGYGPVLLAGSEMILFVKNSKIEINDSSLQLYK